MSIHQETLSRIHRLREGDASAETELIELHAPLVTSVAARFRHRGEPMEDLLQLGNIGLIKAIRGFDESFGVQFSTYAVPMIIGEIRRFLRDDGPIKVSRALKETAYRAAKVSEELSMSLGREPTVQEVAEKLDMPPAELAMALESQRALTSLNEPVTEDAPERIAALPAPTDDPSVRVHIQHILDHLEPQEKQVIVMRYFMDMTQTEIAKKLGISQVQVSRVESRTLKRMQTWAG